MSETSEVLKLKGLLLGRIYVFWANLYCSTETVVTNYVSSFSIDDLVWLLALPQFRS
jgi:hypothetical protein